MILKKLIKKLRPHFLCLTLTTAFLSLFSLIVKSKLAASNIDYTIRDYAARTLNTPNYGQWVSPMTSTQTLFAKPMGSAEFQLNGDLKILEDSLFQSGFDKLTINLHERVDISSTNATIPLLQGHLDVKNSMIVFNKQITKINSIKASNVFEFKHCEIGAQLALLWNPADKRYQETVDLESSDCPEFNLRIKGDLLSQSIKRWQVILHTIFSLVILSLLIVSILLLERQLAGDLASNHQLSMTSMLIMGTMNLVLGFEQIVLALFDFPFFILIVIIAVLYFNMFFFLLFKTVASAVKYQMIHHLRSNQNFNLRTYILYIYCKAHFIILATFFVSFKLVDSPYLFFIWSLALTPQIFKNATSKTRFLSSQNYVSLYFFLTMIYAIYMHFFRYNFFVIDYPSTRFTTSFALNIMILTLVQVGCIVLQEILHPFFFLPSKLRPVKSFDYFFGHSQLRSGDWAHKKHEQCIICFNNLDKDLNHDHANHCNPSCCHSSDPHCIKEIDADIENPQIDVPLTHEEDDDQESVIDWRGVVKNQALKEFLETQEESNRFMGTPCGHVFHTSCLMVWMSQKMECPVCRQSLPAIV